MTDFAIVGGRLFTQLQDLTTDLAALESDGSWVVVIPYSPNNENPPVCARFANTSHASDAQVVLGRATWRGLGTDGWTTSLDRCSFEAGVDRIRGEIAAGNVYQVNLTRRLGVALGEPLDLWAMACHVSIANPAPHAAVVNIDRADLQVVSASPELFLGRHGRRVWSSPIKGTASTSNGFLAKDDAENVMIVDLVRNDLGRICEWGTITVPRLLAHEEHPGLFHLVSTVQGELREGVGWPEMVEAAFPAGSITGAPKIAAMELINELEPVDRGVYCGAIGWVDADAEIGELSVTIRTFWVSEDHLWFGTGGGITYDSSPAGEWAETELKASRLIDAVQRGIVPG